MAIRTIPSLVVGLGGTGKRALTHLKRRILDTYQRDNLPWVRLLSIDTDDGAVSNPPVISQLTGEIVQLGISETRVIDQSDTPKIISNLDAPENRHIKDWYPDPGMNVDFPKAAKGSGQVRMFGRIGLYKGENLYTNYRWLQQAHAKTKTCKRACLLQRTDRNICSKNDEKNKQRNANKVYMP